jgi:hypothetical protein
MDDWQAMRKARLILRAREMRADIEVLLPTRPTRLLDKHSTLLTSLAHLQAYREQPTLLAERFKAYAPALHAETCPQCWLERGVTSVLIRAAVRQDVEEASCPECSFAEFLPAGSGAPGFLKVSGTDQP